MRRTASPVRAVRRSCVLVLVLYVLAGCGKGGVTLARDDGGNVAGTASSGPVTPKGTGITGVVTDRSGGPVELANMTAEPVEGDAPTGPVTQEANVTDAEGQFFVPLKPGTWRLTARAEGYRPATEVVEVGDGAPTTQDLVLRPDS